MKNLKLSALAFLCAVSVPVMAGMAVTDPVSYTFYAQQLTEGAKNTATNLKQLAEESKQTVTQNEIFLTSKEIWTTARETQKVTEDAYSAVTGLYYTPEGIIEDVEREQARYERNPPRYLDRVFAKYGHREDEENGDNLPPVELEEKIKQQTFQSFSSGRGLYRGHAVAKEREEAALSLMGASEIAEHQLGNPDSGYLEKLKEHSSKHVDATTLATKMDVLISLATLQVEMQAKQLELQAKMAKAYAAMNYQGSKDLATDKVIKASETAPRTDYSEVMNRDSDPFKNIKGR